MAGREEQIPFVLSDRAMVAVAASTAAGAWFGGGPGRLAGAALVGVAVIGRRPWIVCAGCAVLAAALADGALAGLDPVEAGSVSGWVTLVDDPVPLDSGAVRVTVLVKGRRLEATAFGGAAAALRERLAGERVVVRGRRRPPPEDAPWLVARRVVGRLSIDELGEWAPGSAASRLANAVRRTLAEGAQHLPRRERALLAGVVLGDDREQPPEVTDDFRAAGLSHLLAVSGQNVAFVLAAAGPVLTRLRWRWRLPATSVVLAGFALLVRFEPSVLRAVAMAVVATIAAASGRPAAGLRVLALAVTVLVLVDPLLVRSVGFGLSVSASAAILAIAPRLRVALHGPAWVVEPLAVTLAAQLGTLPLLVATFGGVPVASVPANLLAVPAAGPLMVWGITAGLVAGVVPPGAGWLLHLPTSALTSWLAWVASWAAALPLGEVGAPHGAVLALAALFVVARHRRGLPGAGPVAALLAASVVVAAIWCRPQPHDGPDAVGPSSTVWSAGGATVLELQGPVDTRRLLADLRRTGARCVDAVAVGGGGRSAGVAAAALARRCSAEVVAPAGVAHPGWTVIAPGSVVGIGSLVVGVTPSGDLAVGRAPPATFQSMPDADGQPEPGDDELVRLADVALAATLGELPPEEEDDRVTRRVRTVIEAIRAADES
jgi:competence protein ComEC